MTMFHFPTLIRAAVATLAASASLALAAPADDEALLERLQRAKAELQAVQAELDAKLARAQAASAPPAPPAPARTAAEPAAAAPDLPDLAPAEPAVVKVAARSFDPLRLRVVMNFPANVKTVQHATQYLLETANYKLALSPEHPEQTRLILSRPLAPQDRDGSLKAIEDALLQLSGDDTVLVIDRENKLLSFEFYKP